MKHASCKKLLQIWPKEYIEYGKAFKVIIVTIYQFIKFLCVRHYISTFYMFTSFNPHCRPQKSALLFSPSPHLTDEKTGCRRLHTWPEVRWVEVLTANLSPIAEPHVLVLWFFASTESRRPSVRPFPVHNLQECCLQIKPFFC